MLLLLTKAMATRLQTNGYADFGLTHAQAPTANEWGLRTHGTTKKYADKGHATRVKEMLARCEQDIVCAERHDDRFNPLRSLDMTGRVLASYHAESEGIQRWHAGSFTRGKSKKKEHIPWKSSSMGTSNKLKRAPSRRCSRFQ